MNNASALMFPIDLANDKSLYFDGIDARLHLADDAYNSYTVGSFACWFKYNAADGIVFSFADDINNGFYAYLRPKDIGGGDVRLEFDLIFGAANIVYGNTRLVEGTWYHGCVVADNTDWYLYVNGQTQSLTLSAGANYGWWFNKLTTGGASGSMVYTIGCLRRNVAPSGFFEGYVDEPQIFDYALSADQVRALYQAGRLRDAHRGGIPSNPIAWFRNGDSAL